MKTSRRTPLLFAVITLLQNALNAQMVLQPNDQTLTTASTPAPYLADLETDPSGTTRLYLDTAETTAAPVGTTLWLVADLTGSAMPTGQVPADTIQNIINGVGNAQRFFTDIVDGTLLGSQAGRYQHLGISVPGTFQTAHIDLVLWNDANHDNVIGNAGDTFGVYSFGVVPPPAVGNAFYSIIGNVHADENTVTAVPEPASTAVCFGLLCLAGASLERIVRRAKRL